MKKLLSLILLCGIINAYEIKFNKSFEKSIEPNFLSTKVQVESENKNEMQVKDELDRFSIFFKNLKNVKLKQASLNINPKYSYEKEKATCTGYRGSLQYQINAQNAKDMNDFIKDFLAFKEKTNPDIKINLSRIHWEINKKTYQKTIGELRLEALLWVKDYAKELEKSLDAKCGLKEAIFNESPRYFARDMVQTYAATNAKKFSSFSSETYLVKGKEDIRINPNFTIKCK